MADVRMIERRENLRFTTEASEAFRMVRDLGQQDLERHVTIELGVMRAIHLAHPAGAEQGDDLVEAEARAGGEGHWVGGSIAGLSRSTSQQLARLSPANRSRAASMNW